MTRIVVGGVGGYDLAQQVRIEDIVPHGGKRLRRVSRHCRRDFWLLDERADATVGFRVDDPKLAGLVERHRNSRDGDAGAGFEMKVDHLLDVHAVDVVGAEHRHQIGPLVAENIQILEHRVGRASEPSWACSHLGRHRDDVVAEQRRQAPGLGQVTIQAVAQVLREDDDVSQSASDHVRQDEVDEPVLATEGDRRLGAQLG